MDTQNRFPCGIEWHVHRSPADAKKCFSQKRDKLVQVTPGQYMHDIFNLKPTDKVVGYLYNLVSNEWDMEISDVAIVRVEA